MFFNRSDLISSGLHLIFPSCGSPYLILELKILSAIFVTAELHNLFFSLFRIVECQTEIQLYVRVEVQSRVDKRHLPEE